MKKFSEIGMRNMIRLFDQQIIKIIYPSVVYCY